MKLRNPRLIRLAAWAGAGVIRCWVRTLRVRADARGQWTDPWDPNLRERFMYTLWHENLAVAFALKSAAPLRILISQSADGELLSQLAHRFGVETIRGSSTHGAVEAMDQLLESGRTHHLLTAIDGPQGPRRKAKRGFAYLASRTGMRIVPFGVGFSRAWRARSWDRTAIPKPGCTLTIVAGPIIRVPPNVGKRALEDYRLTIEQSLEAANAAADAWATGRKREITWPVVAAEAA
jgi:lysophospholipid acyltransferase (LPLAT)-like uncharacterized protein